MHVRENQRGNQEWTIEDMSNIVHKTQYEDKQKKNTNRKLKRRATRYPSNTIGEPRCSRKISSANKIPAELLIDKFGKSLVGVRRKQKLRKREKIHCHL